MDAGVSLLFWRQGPPAAVNVSLRDVAVELSSTHPWWFPSAVTHLGDDTRAHGVCLDHQVPADNGDHPVLVQRLWPENTMTIHLTNARVAAPTPPQQQEDTAHMARLLHLWCERTACVAAAAAHHPHLEQGLFDLQQQAERPLRAHSQKWDRRVDQLMWWEASLIHHGEVPAANCLTCRRARIDAATLASRVIDGGAL